MQSQVEQGSDFEFVDLSPSAKLWEAAAEALSELREGLTSERLVTILHRAEAESLTFTACCRGDVVMGVAGWRVMTTTYADRKLHVDDLVVGAAHRRAGVGAALIGHLVERGRALGCTAVDLDSRVHRFQAHRFYLRQGFDIAAHHFLLPLDRSE